MTSSLRNSIHRRNHKERSQLVHRTRFGILEKHKDYVQRARDYHSKQDRLTRLKQNAAERNKDEFYFSMRKEKTREGVHLKDRGNSVLPVDIVKVLKTQDENYVRTMRMAGLKKIEKLKAQLTALADLVKPIGDGEDEDGLDEKQLQTLQGAGVLPPSKKGRKRSKHIIFVEDEDEAREYVKSRVALDDAPMDIDTKPLQQPEQPLDLGWKLPTAEKRTKKKPTIDADNDDLSSHPPADRKEEAAQHRTRLLRELSARLARDTQLRYAEREFEMQRLLMGKGRRRKLRGVEKVEGDKDEAEDEDELDARKGRPRKGKPKVVDEATWKPRVYKWKVERKK